MASGPITSWQIERGKVEAVTDFIFLGSNIIVDGDGSHEIKRCFLLGSKAAGKSPYSQSYGFSSSHIQMWELDHIEGWALKNWCFQTLVLQKTLENPLDSKKIKPVNPKGNQPWKLMEGLMLKLKLQYFGQLMQTAKSLEKTLMLGKIEDRRRRGRQRMRCPCWISYTTIPYAVEYAPLGVFLVYLLLTFGCCLRLQFLVGWISVAKVQ